MLEIMGNGQAVLLKWLSLVGANPRNLMVFTSNILNKMACLVFAYNFFICYFFPFIYMMPTGKCTKLGSQNFTTTIFLLVILNVSNN